MACEMLERGSSFLILILSDKTLWKQNWVIKNLSIFLEAERYMAISESNLNVACDKEKDQFSKTRMSFSPITQFKMFSLWGLG